MATLATLANTAYIAHKMCVKNWEEGKPVDVWRESEEVICVRYESGRYFHYKDLELPFPTWW